MHRLRKAYEAAIESDDETGVTSAAGPPRSRNEATELPPVVVRTDVLPETAMIAPLGRISGIVETFVLVQSHSGVAPLDASSLLCLGSRRVLGQVRPPRPCPPKPPAYVRPSGRACCTCAGV